MNWTSVSGYIISEWLSPIQFSLRSRYDQSFIHICYSLQRTALIFVTFYDHDQFHSYQYYSIV